LDKRRGDQAQEHEKAKGMREIWIPPDPSDERYKNRQDRCGTRVGEPKPHQRFHLDLAFG
jgi:hypothetical protein